MLEMYMQMIDIMDAICVIGYRIVMSSFLRKFGLQIKTYRELRGFTQEHLAEKIDVATNTVSAWENGKFFLEYPSIQKLCNALEITEEDLFGFACSKDANEILNLIKQLTPEQQKHIIEIIKTFIK